MNKFEAVVLISPELSVSVLKDSLKHFEDIISSKDGKIVNSEDWGLRDLSYDINNFKKAFYNYYQLELNGSNIENITKIINQNDKFIRHLFIKVNKHQELPTVLKNEKK
tara:strand:+ start:14489 stop:14815 length:327 start_codon:yes stop_codon:yes gene_type:complete